MKTGQPMRSLIFPMRTSLVSIFRPIASTSMFSSKAGTHTADTVPAKSEQSKQLQAEKSEAPDYVLWNGKRYKVHYKSLIEEEVNAAKLEYWIRNGYVHPITHSPLYWAARYLRGKRPSLEHIKAWQFHFQKEDGKLVWQKGSMDPIINWIIMVIITVVIGTAVANIYYFVTPASSNPWVWKGEKKKDHH